jgi:hypothetical protein
MTPDSVLVANIVNELRNDSLKRRVSAELDAGNRHKKLSDFFQHPAVLLVISFFVTGLIGAFLTQRWQMREWDRQQQIQSREWERQQLRQLDIHGINAKYALIDDITKAVGERNAAVMAIVDPLLDLNSDQVMLNAEQEPIRNWQKVTNEWRANSHIIKQKLAVHIRSAAAADAFDAILRRQKKINGEISTVRDDLTHYNREDDPEAQKFLQGILNDVAAMGEDLRRLTDVIVEETKKQLQAGP